MSYLFDANEERLVANAFPLPSNTTQCTFAAWVYLSDATPASTGYILTGGQTGSGTNQIALAHNSSNGRAYIYVVGPTTISEVAATPEPVDTYWFLYVGVGTFDGSSTCTGLDAWGYETSTGTESGAISVATKSRSLTWPVETVIGCKRSSSTAFTGSVAGYIAHCAIWNTVLSDANLDTLKTQAPPYVASGNLVAYWPLLADANCHADFGGSSYDLTATGATLDTNPGTVGPSITLWTGGTSVAPRAMGAYSRMRNG